MGNNKKNQEQHKLTAQPYLFLQCDNITKAPTALRK